MWSLRNSSSHLTGWESGRSWKRDLFPKWMEEMGPVTKKLYDTLTGIQMGHIKAPESWIKVIK